MVPPKFKRNKVLSSISLTQKYAPISQSSSGVAPVSCVKAHTDRFLSAPHLLQSFPSLLYFIIITLFSIKVNGFANISEKTAHIKPYDFKISRFFLLQLFSLQLLYFTCKIFIIFFHSIFNFFHCFFIITCIIIYFITFLDLLYSKIIDSIYVVFK